MNADCAFTIGSTHSICQDYAVAVPGFTSNGIEAGPYVVISDGCSSSPDTDVGARLLTRATRQIFSVDVEVAELHKESAQLALRWAELLGLPTQSVDATLLTANLNRDDLIIGCSGDGVVVLETREGRVDVHAISSPSGYPFYPCYAHQPERLDELIARGRAYKELKHFRRVSAGEPLTLVNESTSDSLTEVFRFKVSDHKYAALVSDGIYSFFSAKPSIDGKRVEAIPMVEALNELWSFKNSHGAFVSRRVNKFKKDCRAKEWRHADDLAFGALYLGE